MTAAELISNTISPLQTSDTGEEALTHMNVFHVKHLPIVNQKQLLGLVSEEDILRNNLEEPLGSYRLGLHRPYVKSTDHLFEVMATLADNQLTIVPVVDKDENFLGIITLEELVHHYAKSYSFSERGSIIVIESSKKDFAMSEICRIVEMEGASVLSSWMTQEEGSNKIFITVKLNVQDIQRIVASLNRYEYVIMSSFSEEEYLDNLHDRYDSLMNYLNV